MRIIKWKAAAAALLVGGLVGTGWLTMEARSQQPAEVNAPVFQETRPEYQDLVPSVRKAIWGDAMASAEGSKELRAKGPRAATYLFERGDLRAQPRFDAVIDEVCLQKDAKYSGCYWYRSLPEALAVAEKERKPVLSLRLLGNLTDELSCANSRFFRTTLYPQIKVRTMLSKHFVLHWEPVRPVPVITIDLPEGRQIKQTITGNSLHLVLDWKGRPVDVLPGLYGGVEFERQLAADLQAVGQLAELTDSDFAPRVAEFHQRRISESQETLAASRQHAEFIKSLQGAPTDEQWAEMASLYQSDSLIDGYARSAITEKSGIKPNARAAGKLAMTKMVVERPMFAGMKKLMETLALDTVKNEFGLHRTIHQHMAQYPTLTRDELVTYVYASVFLSPLDDPWYGLSQPDVYAALPNNGRINAVTQNASR